SLQHTTALSSTLFSYTTLFRSNISFPQANSFERVINICELLNAQELSREQVTEEYAFDIRQTNYYTDAARYLGLLEKHYEDGRRSEEHTSELQSRFDLVCRLLL